MIPMYNTKRFTQIWDNATDFANDYKASALYETPTTTTVNGVTKINYHNSLSDANITKLFYLLYARYANNPLANLDENQFKYKVYLTIFQYGPNWQKELDIQEKLRNLSDTEIAEGQFAIYNQAANDATAPSTHTTQELDYINNQSTSRLKKAKLNAYNDLLLLLKTDVTKKFIDKFEPLFKKFLYEPRPTIYVTDIDEEEEDE